jgi:hypothetical protein
MPPELDVSEYSMVEIPYVRILSHSCEIIAEYECIDIYQARIKRNRCLADGQIAVIIYRRVPWHDAIPF